MSCFSIAGQSLGKAKINIDKSASKRESGLHSVEDRVLLHVHWGWEFFVFGERLEQLRIK
jgi:hypothetical protein